MSGVPTPQRLINDAAEQHRAAWQRCFAHPSPAERPELLAEYRRHANSLPVNWQAALLRLLLVAELDVRRRHNETPSPGDYERLVAELLEVTDCARIVEDLVAGLTAPQQADPLGGGVQAVPRPKLGVYELLEELGSGGMGTVWKAARSCGPLEPGDRGTHRDGAETAFVAIKRIRPHIELDRVVVQRFLREGHLGSKLQHPNVIPILEVGHADGHHFIVMPFLEGGSLQARLGSYLADPRHAAELLLVVTRAVDYLHAQGILHRDLKPDNILFGAAAVYVSDLGLAKQLEQDDRLTSTGRPLGTPSYMSPEQFRGEKSLTVTTDVYSLGAIMYALLTGRPPFRETDFYELRKRVLSDQPQPPSSRNPDVPKDLDDVCMDCLEKEPNRRYPSASALADNLDRYLRGVRVRPAAAPAPRYQMFKVGDVELRVRRIIGGDGKTRYTHPDGIRCKSVAERFELPQDVAEVAPAILEERQRAARARHALFENRPMVRLDDYEFGMGGDDTESPYPLELYTSVTDYFTMQVTNSVLDHRLRSGRTIREQHTREPDDLRNSRLANPLATNLSVITRDRQIYIVKRGLKVGMNPGGWAPAVSGTGSPELDCVGGAYCPFLTAKREAGQEILGGYELPLSEITFFGLARTLGFHFPFLFGELRIGLTAKELESQVPSDVYETTGLVSRPFTIEDVTAWVLELYQELDEQGQPTARAHTTIFSLLQSLRYAYPGDRDWRRVVNLLEYK